MNIAIIALILVLALLAAMLLAQEFGFRIGRRHARNQIQPSPGLGVIEAAALGLLGLVIAFTYGGAESRLAQRRELIVQEANAIGTAYLRLDLLPENERSELKDLFKGYVDCRIDVFKKLPDQVAAEKALESATELQEQIWNKAISALRQAQPYASILLVPALNAMFDVATARQITSQTHVPELILALLVSVSLLCSILTGYGLSDSEHRSILHMAIYAAIVVLTIYSIIDLEYPRLGLIREDDTDKVLIQLRHTMR